MKSLIAVCAFNLHNGSNKGHETIVANGSERPRYVFFQANFQRLLCGGVGLKISEMSKITSCNKKIRGTGTACCENPTSTEWISLLNETNTTRCILFQPQSSCRVTKIYLVKFYLHFQKKCIIQSWKWTCFTVSMATIC